MDEKFLEKKIEVWEEEVSKMKIPKPFNVKFLERNQSNIEFEVDNSWPAHLVMLAKRLNEPKIPRKRKLKSCRLYLSWENSECKTHKVFHVQAKNIVKEYINWVNEFGK